MPNALHIGLLGPLQVRDETGRPVRVGGRQLRVLLTLLALNAGRVVPAGSLAGHIWPDDPPGNLWCVPAGARGALVTPGPSRPGLSAVLNHVDVTATLFQPRQCGMGVALPE